MKNFLTLQLKIWKTIFLSTLISNFLFLIFISMGNNFIPFYEELKRYSREMTSSNLNFEDGSGPGKL